jgi:hypothetical protein
MPSAGFEPKIPASERLQTHALDHAATGIGSCVSHGGDYKEYWLPECNAVYLSQNQQKHKIINKYVTYLQALHMFRQINCHLQGVIIKKLQVLIVSNYTIPTTVYLDAISTCSSLINTHWGW